MPEMNGFVIEPKPPAYFGAGAIAGLPAILRAIGADQVVVVTDAAMAPTPVIATVQAALAGAAIPSRLFSGVRPNPTTDDLAAGAEAIAEAAAEATASASAAAEAAAVAATLKASAPLVSPLQPPVSAATPTPQAPLAPPALSPPRSFSPPATPSAPRIALVAVGGRSPIDAAKGIAIAAVNPQRDRDLDYRRGFAVPALPIVAVPTTAGPGAETNAVGMVTDSAAHRRFYVGHADRNAEVAIGAIAALRDRLGLNRLISEFGITEDDFSQIAADALADEVLASAPRQPTEADIGAILLASAGQRRPG